MKLIPQKVISMTLFLCVFTIIFSCSKDTDLLLESVLNDPEISVEEKERMAEEEVSEDGLVTRTFTFSPTNDAYLQNEQGHDQSIVRLQEDYRTSYLMFDLSDVNGTITEAVLQFSVDSDEGDGSIAVHKGISADWTEENLTINNAPGLETQLGSLNKTYKIGAAEKVVLNANNLSAEATTFVMTHSTGNDLAFASKEHPANKGPKLVITYMAPEGSPFIEQQEENDTEEEGNQNNNTQDDNSNTQEDNSNTQEDNSNTQEDNQSNNNTASTEGAYYVTTFGSASNDGRSEATAWSIEYAFETAVAGDVIYIKAGDYGNKQLVVDNSGNSNNPIKFIGYTNSPGDLVSNQGSTFNYGESLDSNKMPLIRGSSSLTGVGLSVPESYVEVHNFQITDYQFGVISNGRNVVLKNLITNNNGEQNHNNSQTGRGFHIFGDFSVVENCFSLNSNAEGINIKGANNCLIRHTKVYSDNYANPGGYYIAITFGGSNNIIEDCIIYRDKNADKHRGHGYIMKDKATNNIVRRSKAYHTGIEVNFSGVSNNTFEDIEIYGSASEDSGEFASGIRVVNGAHHNTFQRIYIENSRYPFNFHDFDDGFVNPDGDRDLAQGGNYNKFIEINTQGSNSLVFCNTIGATLGQSTSVGNTWENCTFNNVSSIPFNSSHLVTGFEFKNCTFSNISGSTLWSNIGNIGTWNASYQNCEFTNVSFPIPN